MVLMGRLLIAATFLVYAAFWTRLFMHVLAWWKAQRLDHEASPPQPRTFNTCMLTAADILFFNRLLNVNPALWIGEWVFHASFLLVLLRHLRYFLDPVPILIWRMQTPGLIAGYILPFSLLYILFIRIMTRHEKYTSRQNLSLLGLAFGISSIGVMMHAWFKPDLVNVKLFILGILSFAPAALPGSVLFVLHFSLFLIFVLLLPSHIVSAPFVMIEARKREQGLHLVIHEK